jgi:hypothetical protein
MRSSEFTIPYNERLSRVQQTFAANGYKLLGSGSDKTIWHKEGRSVVGVIMPLNRSLTEAMRAFNAIYQLSQMYPDNPHLPRYVTYTDENGKVNHYKTFTLDGMKFVQFGMEKLDKLPENSPVIKIIDIMRKFAGNTKTKIPWANIKSIIEHYMKRDYKLSSEDIAGLIPDLKRFYETVYLIMQVDSDILVDVLDESNVMQREGVPVFVDPYYVARVDPRWLGR